MDGRSVKDGGSAKLVIKGLVDVENDDVSVIQANKGDVSIGGGKIIAKGDKASSLKINNDGKSRSTAICRTEMFLRQEQSNMMYR